METIALVLGVLCVIVAAIAAALGILILTIAAQDRLDQRRRRRQEDPGNYGVDISVWPSRAPRNGSTHGQHDVV